VVSIACATALTTVANAGGPESRPLKVGGKVTVIMNETAETSAKLADNQEGIGQYAAQLVQFIRINSKGNLDRAGKNSPEIDGELQSRLQSTGKNIESRSVNYKIGATVVGILPNGLLVIAARKWSVDNKEAWAYTLDGKVDPKQVSADGSVLSKNVADLAISKCRIHLYDCIGPF
jgi:flagellar L-ring protein precursor FlgH